MFEQLRLDENLFGELKRVVGLKPTNGESESVFAGAVSDRKAPDIDVPGFQILGELRRGGQGIVFKAIQKATRRPVALKILLNGPLSSLRERSRFEREINVAASLRHQGIVTIYESGAVEDRPYFAMEFIEGLPLDLYLVEWFRSIEAIWPESKVREMLALFAKICDAVQHAHQNGVLHRDLKPANIMIDSQGQPHVLDFGLAKARDGELAENSLTKSGEFIGTLAYASPEHTSGKLEAVDARSDVYSLGIILYQILTGRFPYEVDGSLSSVILNITQAKPVSVQKHNPSLGHEIDAIVQRALAKEPSRRYQTVDHLRRDILHYLAGEPIDARRDSTWYLLRKTIRRHRKAVSAIATMLVVILVALVVSFEAWRRAERANESERIARLQAESNAYLADIAAADASIRVNDVVSAATRLANTPQHLRNWEADFLETQLEQSEEILKGHSLIVTAVAWLADSKRLLSGSFDNKILCWDAQEGKQIWSLDLPAKVADIAMDKDPQQFLVGQRNGRVSIHSSQTGDFVREFTGAHAINSIAVSPHGDLIAAACGETPRAKAEVVIWDRKAGKIKWRIGDFPRLVFCVAFTPDGKSLIAGGHHIRWIDCETGKATQSLEPHRSWIHGIRSSSDGEFFATASYDNSAKLHRWKNLQSVQTFLGHNSFVNSFDFCTQQNLVATGSTDKTVRIWDQQTGETRATLLGHTEGVTEVQFSPDGRYIASASNDTTVRIWSTRKALATAGHRLHRTSIKSIAFTEDGNQIVSSSSDKTSRFWDLQKSRAGVALQTQSEEALCIALQPRGTQAATTSRDGILLLWDRLTGEIQHKINAHPDYAEALAYHPSGTSLVTGGRDNLIRVWDSNSGTQTRAIEGHDDHVHMLGFSPDGRTMISFGHKSMRIWDGVTHEPIRQIEWSNPTDFFALAFTPDSKYFATALENGAIDLRETSNPTKIVRRFVGHNQNVTSLNFSPDSKRMLSACRDGTIRIWESQTGKEVLSLRQANDFAFCAMFCPNGRYIAAGMYDGMLRIWDSQKPHLPLDPN